jgi:hypothetical protein
MSICRRCKAKVHSYNTFHEHPATFLCKYRILDKNIYHIRSSLDGYEQLLVVPREATVV